MIKRADVLLSLLIVLWREGKPGKCRADAGKPLHYNRLHSAAGNPCWQVYC
jgi:hypothetical protein